MEPRSRHPLRLERLAQLLEIVVSAPRLRAVIRPDRVVAFRGVLGQRKQLLDGAKRAGTVAAAARQLAEREVRRLRGRKERRRALVGLARLVVAAERLVLGAEKKLRIVP